MRICLISTTYRPRTGGLETHVTTLAEHLARLGHQVTVFTARDRHQDAARDVDHRVTVVRSGALLEEPDPSEVAWERALFGPLRDLEQLLASDRFDVVHTHTQAALLLASLAGLGATRTPIVASLHETTPEADPCGTARSRFILSNCPAALVVAGSREFARQAAQFGVPEHRIRVIPLGLPQPGRTVGRRAARQLLHRTAGVPTDGVLITLTGRYTPRKAQARLLDAYPLMRHRAGARLVLCGSLNGSTPGYLSQLQDQAHALGERVTVLVDQDDQVRDLLAQGADIITQPSTREGLGLAVIEGMRMANPAVVHDTTGLREVVTADTGLLIDTTDPAAYADALDRLTADPEQRRALGHAARTRAREVFGIERCTRFTLAAYREAIALTAPEEAHP